MNTKQALGICLVVGITGSIVSRLSFSHSLLRDFYAFWTAGRLTLVGANLYDYSLYPLIQIPAGWNPEIDGSPAMSFVLYPPWVGMLFAPLGLLDYDIARSWWLAINLGMLIAIGITLSRLLDIKPVIIWSAIILFPFVWMGLAIGQGAILGLLLVTLLFYCFSKERFFMAGIVLALTLSRPQLTWGIVLLSLVVLLIQKRLLAIVGFGVALGLMAGISFVIWPAWPMQLYQGIMSQPFSATDRPWINPTSYSLLATLLGLNWTTFAIWGIFSLGIISLTLYKVIQGNDLGIAVIGGIALAFLAGFYLRPYDLTIMLLPFLIMAQTYTRLVVFGGLLSLYGQEIYLYLTEMIAFQLTLLWLALIPLMMVMERKVHRHWRKCLRS